MLTRIESILVELVDFEAGVSDCARLFGAAATRVDLPPEAGREACVRFELANVALELRPATLSPRAGIRALRFAYLGEERSADRAAARPGRVPIEFVAEPAQDAFAPRSREGMHARAGAAFSLDHVVIATAEPERALRDFGETLGIRLALDRRFPERGLRLLFFRLGGATLEVAARIEDPAVPRESAPPLEADSFRGLAWRVASLDTERARLEGAGFDLSPIRPGHKPGTRVCTVRAPVHDIPTLLIEHPPR